MIHCYLPEKDKQELFLALIEVLFAEKEMLATDSDGTILMVTDHFAKSLGLTADKVLGQTVYDLMRQNYYQNSASVQALTHRKSVYVLSRSSGHYTLAHSVPIFKKGSKDKIQYLLTEGTSMQTFSDMLDAVVNSPSPFPEEVSALRKKLYASRQQVISHSKAMEVIVKQAEQISAYAVNTLLLGESGTGKDVIARYIHENSPYRSGPFVPVCIPMVAPSLLESELFDYESGSFTNANKEGKRGLFEIANGGTVYLDEVGDIPLDMQVKLLRVLENREIFRVGGTVPIPLDVRIIAATNKDLPQMVAQGRFREDLFYRLNIFSIRIPPLRERREDILPLCEYFLTSINDSYGINKKFSPAALLLLERQEWRGNSRELRNVVERLAILSPTDEISEAFTSKIIQESIYIPAELPISVSPPPQIINFYRALSKESIIAALNQCGGNKRKAAETLNVSRSFFYKKLREYGLIEKHPPRTSEQD